MTRTRRPALALTATFLVAALLMSVGVAGRAGRASAGTTGSPYQAFAAVNVGGVSGVSLANVSGPASTVLAPNGRQQTRVVAVNSTATILLVGGSFYGNRLPVNGLIEINPRTDAQIGSLSLGGPPVVAIAMDPQDSNTAFILRSNGEIDRVSLGASLTATAIANVSQSQFGQVTVTAMAITPDASQLLVSFGDANGDNGVFDVQAGTGKISFWYDNEPGTSGAVDVAVSPQGGFVYLASVYGDAGYRGAVIGLPLPLPASAAFNGNEPPWYYGLGGQQGVGQVVTPKALTVSPDGTKVYLVGQDYPGFGAVESFTGGPSGGKEIAAADIDSLEWNTSSGIGGPAGVAEAPDSSTVLVAGNDQKSGNNLVIPVSPSNLQSGSPATLGNAGQFQTAENIAITPDQAPTATLAGVSGTAGSSVNLDASGSNVIYGSITTYSWSFGDGATATTNSPTVSHTYASSGNYTATVTETDSAGVSVPPAPNANGQPVLTAGVTPYANANASARASASVSIAPRGSTIPTPAPTNSTTSTTKPSVYHPKIILNPGLGSPGSIVDVTGTGFKPNSHVTIKWSTSTGSVNVTADGSGKFPAAGHVVQLFILTPDVLGPRFAVATAPGNPAAKAPFLVIPNSAEPGGGSSDSFLFRSEGP